MAGYEGADHVNLHGRPLDMVAISGHASQMQRDYGLAAAQGLRTVRESVGWRACCPRGAAQRDFSRLRRSLEAAEASGLQILWTLMHYGTPPDVQVMDLAFGERFADFAGAAAREIRGRSGRPGIYNPINEIGFLAWAMATRSLVGGSPAGLDGYLVKCQLVRACLHAIEAIRAEDAGARFLHVEPLIHVVAPVEDPTLQAEADRFSEYQWQAWDMLLGRLAPELGGTPAAVDWIGANHYHDAQWEVGTGRRLDWDRGDARRAPFSELLMAAWQRYHLPMIVAETSHVGEGRARWIDEIARETSAAMGRGATVEGICLYPAVDRPDWNDLDHWHRSGLWDAVADEGAPSDEVPRRLAQDYAQAVQGWRDLGR